MMLMLMLMLMMMMMMDELDNIWWIGFFRLLSSIRRFGYSQCNKSEHFLLLSFSINFDNKLTIFLYENFIFFTSRIKMQCYNDEDFLFRCGLFSFFFWLILFKIKISFQSMIDDDSNEDFFFSFNIIVASTTFSILLSDVNVLLICCSNKQTTKSMNQFVILIRFLLYHRI